MTRILILTRHAKSSWDSPGLGDHDRPLNKRGRKSAPAIAAWLRHHGWLPDEVLSSTSTRTRETWDRMGLQADKVSFHSALYHADSKVMLRELSGATEPAVLMLGHNPGIADFANRLVRQPPNHIRFFDYPTCATTVMSFDISGWAEVRWQTGTVLGFTIPRELIE
ncbi:histidine phosphatase family protein [Ruegeria sp. HKCCD6157]|uniref:SixA phosphatase family protein n=1 Tax=Ruegeria sp. HKCCD6157 TaxID=2690707 RepID=UPI00149319D1|nr:histidine phosphatase family protein [Ruegeria sp. HKCCD6157]NOE27769.1 histidine phosphatase family protein [Ruegeria sp. HKCCD6157]